MAATPDNADIKSGINQIVQAILDLIAGGMSVTIPDGAIVVNVTNNVTAGSSGAGGCGGCGGGNGQLTDDEPGAGQPTGSGSGPGGFPDPDGWSELPGEPPYDAYKCQASNFVYDSIYNGLYKIGGLGTILSGITSAALAGQAILSFFVSTGAAFTSGAGVVFFSYVPGWVLASVAGTIGVFTFLAGAGAILIFHQLTTEMAERHEDLVMALYNAGTPGDAQTAFSTILGEVVSAAIIGLPPELEPYGDAFDTMFSAILPYLLPNSLFNKLFDYDATVAGHPTTIDCVPPTIPYTIMYGNELTENPASPIQVEMVYESGYGCGANARHGGISFSGPVTITYFNVSGTGVGQCGGGHICYYYSDDAGVTLITSKPANNTEEVTGVRSIYSFCAVSSGNSTLEIGYLPE